MARLEGYTSWEQAIREGDAAEAAILSRKLNLNGANAALNDTEDDLACGWSEDENIVEFPHPQTKFGASASNVEVALRYAGAGAYVFAARSSDIKALDKKPMFVRSWSAESTRDPTTIKRFFTDSTALVAVDCGKSRIVVIDADRHGGPDGVAELREILGDDLTALGCPIVETAGGGLHLVFAQPFDGNPFGNAEGALKGRGINVRGAGGYVIGVGSVRHDGRSYRQMAGTPDLIEALSNGSLPQVPEALAELIRAPKEKREERFEPERPRQTSTRSAPSAHHDERLRAWKDATFGGIDSDFAAIVDGRNNHLNDVAAYRYGRYCAGGFITKAEAWERCKDACQRNGLWKDDGPGQCRKSFESGFGAGFLRPHPGPAEKEVSAEEEEADRRGADIAAKRMAREQAQRETIIVDGVEIDPETGEVLGEAPHAADAPHPDAQHGAEEAPHTEEAQRQNEGPKKGLQVEIVVASSLAGKPVPPQDWFVDGLIPANNVTMLAGDGGAGKSLLALQAAVAAATNGCWIGFRPKAGKVLFVSAEDEIDELHRRLARICPRLEMLENLAIVPLAGKDAVLAAPEGSNGLLKETPLFVAIRHIIAKHRPDLLVLDTLADLFGGDQIKTVQARQFIGMLRGLALEYGVTVLLLAHPSQNGMSSGTGTSGSAAWNNSVRSRLYFERRVTKDGLKSVEDDTNIRLLTTMKANRAAIGGQIVVRYDNGTFVREETSNLNARDAAHQADNVFLSLLAQFESEDRQVSDKSGANYAPAVFAKHPNSAGTTKRALENAMNRLFETGRIRVEESGPESRRRRKIVLVGAPGEDGGIIDDEENDFDAEGAPDDAL